MSANTTGLGGTVRYFTGSAAVGLLSAVLAGACLLLLSPVLLSDWWTLAVSAAVAVGVPLLFAVAWPELRLRDRLVGAVIGVAASLGAIYAILLWIERAHHQS